MQVKFIDLSRGYEKYGAEIESEVLSVLRSGIYLNGKYTSDLENKLSEYLGVKHAIGVASGTEALYLILKALELPKNSWILVPSFTFIATSEVVVRAGLKPYFVDIEEGTFNLSLESVKNAYQELSKKGERVSAIIAVSLFGVPASLYELSSFCEENSIYLIEDMCQAFGASIKEKMVGSFGIASATSFYPSKPLSTCGDAGMVFTQDKELAQKIRYLKEHGQTKPYYYEYHGVNGRMDEIHAAILKVKFKYFEEELRLRREIASRYLEALSDLKEIGLPEVPKESSPSWSLFTIKTVYRDELKKYLEERGIRTGIYYAYPLHLQPVYEDLGFKEGSLPVTERISKEVLSLPMHPYLTREEQTYVIDAIKDFFKERGK